MENAYTSQKLLEVFKKIKPMKMLKTILSVLYVNILVSKVITITIS